MDQNAKKSCSTIRVGSIEAGKAEVGFWNLKRKGANAAYDRVEREKGVMTNIEVAYHSPPRSRNQQGGWSLASSKKKHQRVWGW